MLDAAAGTYYGGIELPFSVDLLLLFLSILLIASLYFEFIYLPLSFLIGLFIFYY